MADSYGTTPEEEKEILELLDEAENAKKALTKSGSKEDQIGIPEVMRVKRRYTMSEAALS